MSTVFAQRLGRQLVVFAFAVLLAVVASTGSTARVGHAQDAAGSAAAETPWLATYWNNLSLSGSPALTRYEAGIDYNWGYGSPDPAVNPQRFTARWTRTFCPDQAGSYAFALTSDDGARLFVDGELVINGWWAHGVRTFTATRQLASGCHDLRVEYFEQSGIAVVQFEMEGIGAIPPAPTPTPLPPAPATPPVYASWRGEYYNNRYLVGAPVLVRDDPVVNYDWGFGSPAPGVVNGDQFSVRWTQTLNIPAGLYRFRVTVDDGVRLYVDGRLVIDRWQEQAATTFQSPDLNLSGPVPVRLEYFDAAGQALVQLVIESAGGVPAPPQAWLGEYFNNTALVGVPVLLRNDAAVDFNWGYGSPAPGAVNADNFSARWSQTIYFSPGTYRFRVRVDDGARLWVNNALVIDQWKEQAPTEYSGELYLSGGSVPVRLEYVEYSGEAVIRLTWELASGAGGGGGGGGGIYTGESTKTIKPKNKWSGDYFNNPDLAGSPTLLRTDSSIDFDWGHGSPASGINADDFSVRWTATFKLDDGRYRLTAEYDDGVRVYVDGKLVIDDWRVGSIRKKSGELRLDSGDHTVEMEYFERTGVAVARLKIVQYVKASAPIGNLITCVPPQPQNYAWIKLYRLDGNNNWYAISTGIGSINASGFLKIDGLPVDVNRFGAAGEPYKVEQWIDGRVVQSTGDFYAGQPEFRIRPWADNATPFGCP